MRRNDGNGEPAVRLMLDLQACQTPPSRERGVGRYSINLAKALAALGGHELWLAMNGRFPETIPAVRRAFEGLLPRERIVVFQVPGTAAISEVADPGLVQAAEATREHFLAQFEPDVVHVCSLFEGDRDDAVTAAGTCAFPTSVTLHDLIPFVHSDVYLADPVTRAWYFRKIAHLRSAELVLAVSEHSRREAIEILGLAPSRVIAAPAAADDRFVRRAIPAARRQALCERYGLHRPFVLYTSGIDYRKNIEGLLAAFAELPASMRDAHQLVIVCQVQEADRKRLNGLAERLGLEPHQLVLTGYVPDEDLLDLYNLCRLFVFPSLHEGFGLPIVEAMCCGAPVIGSNTSSIPEVVGRSDALFDPSRPTAIAEHMARALGDEGWRQALSEHGLQQARKFSWQETARRAVDAFEVLRAGKGMSRSGIALPPSRERPRLAYVSPLPPVRCGVSTYSVELLPELSRFYDIELIANQPSVNERQVLGHFPMRDVPWFEQNGHRFDRVLYHFGNNVFHQHMFDLVRRHPGVVVLHDFFLSGIQVWLDDIGTRPGLFLRTLYHAHGYPALVWTQAHGRESAMWRYPANRTVTECAVGMIAHSSYALAAARHWQLPDVEKSWRKIPLLRTMRARGDKRALRQQLGLPAGDFVICAFGFIDPIKLNHRLLEAFLDPRLAEDRFCRLVFVGEPCDSNYESEYLKQLVRRIDESPARDRVKITGFVDAEVYQAWLGAADVAVQLRTRPRGETSATALDALANGLPLIVNASGTMAELPDDCVIKIAEAFEDGELVEALVRLVGDQTLRERLGRDGEDYMRTAHDPVLVARQYHDAIEELYRGSSRVRYLRLVERLGRDLAGKPARDALQEAAESVAANMTVARSPLLLVDVSPLIEGTVQAATAESLADIVRQLLLTDDGTIRVEPIRSSGARFRYAREFSRQLLGLPAFGAADDLVEVSPADLVLVLGAARDLSSDQRSGLARARDLGSEICFLVCDGEGDQVDPAMDMGAGLVCMSSEVAGRLMERLAVRQPVAGTDQRIGVLVPSGRDTGQTAADGARMDGLVLQWRTAPGSQQCELSRLVNRDSHPGTAD